MILYICKTCGRWQDVSLGQSLQKVLLDSVFQKASSEHKQSLLDASVFDCPEGHGEMYAVQSNDRLSLREEKRDTDPHLHVVKTEAEEQSSEKEL